ncbi:MAG: hypothetical protein LBI87_02790 [Candidatus Accumulibacter sp.]|jgi:hypothetical protein|nr:hypothetical protein [Accumulibacter sp.]
MAKSINHGERGEHGERKRVGVSMANLNASGKPACQTVGIRKLTPTHAGLERENFACNPARLVPYYGLFFVLARLRKKHHQKDEI